jgi:hypothetical protein
MSSTSGVHRRHGLHILHEPRIKATGEANGLLSNITKSVNLIFVHGLCGSAMLSWTHPRSKEFWPSWLHEEAEYENVRISTFGYDACFKNLLAPVNILGISDFAKQLLDALDLHFDKYGDVGYPTTAFLTLEPHYFRWAQYGWIGR